MHVQDTTQTKTCRKCGESKPATTEYFNREKANGDGFSRWCKACRRAYQETNKAHRSELARSYGIKYRERRAEYFRAYQAVNRERRNEKARANYATNKARKTEYFRAYREANQERMDKRRRAYQEANKARIAERTRIWAATNPNPRRAALQRRRARQRQAEGTHTAQDIQAQYDRQRGRCYYCGEIVGKNFHVDHIVPLSRGGSDNPDNLVIACPHCNHSKGDKLPHEWIEGGRLL